MSATPTAKPARGVGSKPETLTEQAYNRLEEMVVTLALAPGSVVAEQVVTQQDLPVGADADADGRDGELLRDQAGDLRRHCLELQHEAAGVLDGECIESSLTRRGRRP